MQSIASAVFSPFDGARDYAPLLKWILVNTLLAVGVLALVSFGVTDRLETDDTRISIVIIIIFLVTNVHCLTQTIFVSKELTAGRLVRDAIVESGGRPLTVVDDRIVTAHGRTLEPGVVTDHIGDLIAKARTVGDVHLDQSLLLRSLADQLRAREKLGLFVSESLLRLALLGTAVGFILLLIPISELGAFDVDSLRQTLAGMTNGMSIALTVTVTGIGTALVLKFLYYLLDEAVADLFRLTTEVTEVYVVPTLEPRIGSSVQSRGFDDASAGRLPPPKSVERSALSGSVPQTRPATAAPDDDLKQINGLGQRIEGRLKSLGVTRIAQIASWSEDDVSRIDEALKLGGRIQREEWVSQAKALIDRNGGKS